MSTVSNIRRNAAALVCTLVFSSIWVLGAVGPARAIETSGNIRVAAPAA